jgi:hypothetical protein
MIVGVGLLGWVEVTVVTTQPLGCDFWDLIP